jgi:hypothetical protein
VKLASAAINRSLRIRNFAKLGAPSMGIGEHAGFLRTHGADCITVGNDTGEVEIGWYEIASIGVAPD